MHKLNKFQITALVFLSFLIIGLGVYANSFNNEFFWDDDDSIVNNSYIKSFKYLPNYFSENLIAGTGQTTNYWRPVLLISFAFDYQLFNLNPAGFHVHNTVLHIISACLAFLLLYKLTKKSFILSFLPSLFFLIHPLQTEAITYVAGRADPLSTVFSLSTLILYLCLREKKSIKYLLFSLLAFLLGLMTKEQVILLPLLVALIELFIFFSKKNWKQSLKYLTPFFLISIIYFILRITILNFNDILAGPEYLDSYSSSLGVRLLTFTWVINKYFSLLFAPFNLHMAYEVDPVTSLFSWPVLIFLTLMALIIFVSLKVWKNSTKLGSLVAFGFLWFFIILLPRTNIIKINRPMYEHWLYLPMLGFFLALTALTILLLKKVKKEAYKKIIHYILIAVIIIFSIYLSYLTINRNKDWKNPITFYEKNLNYTPESFIQRNNLGMAYAEKNRHEEAIKEYQRAIAISDTYPQVHYNLGNSLVALNKINEAKKEYFKAIEISPAFVLPYQNLFSIYLKNDQKKETLSLLEKLQENTNQSTYNSIAWKIFLHFKDYKSAINSLETLNKIYPNNLELNNLLLQLKLEASSVNKVN
ncbi:MAG: tetratricopeptide repeat protein [Candidatus Pacebacteria bacterium]|nr:tetratricopeptide repeat protein [Candidatus Paceibacterota bacterium]